MSRNSPNFYSKNSTVKANLVSANHLLEETKRQSQTDLQEAKDNYEQRLADMKADEQRHYESALEAKDKANEEAMETLKAHYDKAVKDQQDRFDKTMSRIVTENKAATEDLLKARQKEFAESSSTNIGQIVNPLKETIAKMEEAMQKSSKEAVSINSAMQENLKQMLEQSKATQSTTEELTKAFKHQSKVQGDWGETVLTELLTSQGLNSHIGRRCICSGRTPDDAIHRLRI